LQKKKSFLMKKKGFAKWQKLNHGAKMFCQKLKV
jgi:hypothetical protein